MAKQLQPAESAAPRKAIPFRRSVAPPPSNGLRLLSLLQTTLEPEELIHLFDRELRPVLGYEGVSYRHRGLGLTTSIGRHGRCRVGYRLDLGEAELGELSFSRRRAFSAKELSVLEEAVSLLLYPLRNATRYRQALARARCDGLTGLYNRLAFEDALTRELGLAQRHGDAFSIIVMDLDNFKQINDTYGHQSGDRVLIELAEVLRSCARQTDLLFRYAGDEFVVAMNRTDAAGAAAVAERIRERVAAMDLSEAEQRLCVRVSLGLAEAAPGESAEELFHRADRAMLEAKQAGRDCCRSADAS